MIQDGTHGVRIKPLIKVLDGATTPMAQNVKASMRLQAARGTPHWGVTVDVEGAHRIVRARPLDWPLLACQVYPGGDVYLNKCGTFGISSAAYWWGRLAAAVQRSGLYVLGPLLPLWVLLFADDSNLTAEGVRYARSTLAFVWWLVVLGVP